MSDGVSNEATATTASPTSTTPITSRVILQGRYFIHQDTGERFLMRGIAFPIAPISRAEARPTYHPDGWVDIVRQVRLVSSKLNTIRLYQLDMDAHDYSDFFEQARLLGFYLLVPLTTDAGEGVLDRNMEAPACYTPGLYRHGRRVLDMTWLQYPNVIGGVLGNEVMNSLPTWAAAPCLLAYARDLKLHYANTFVDGDETRLEPPLIYTMQHDGIGAAISPAGAVQLTLEYMTRCGTIDILGINIESWCSSLQTFQQNEDGSIGSYLDLYNHVVNASADIPLIFSETGCSTELFNRDNGLERYSRDWKQLNVIETEMSDSFSGFIAYAYDGPPAFRMTQGGPWDGKRPLSFAKDMHNFIHEVELLRDENVYEVGNASILSLIHPKTCPSILAFLSEHCEIDLIGVDNIPSYYVPNEITLNATVIESNDDETDSNNPPRGILYHNVANLIHEFPWNTVFILIMILGIFLVPFLRNKLASWRDTVCVQSSMGTTTIMAANNGDRSGAGGTEGDTHGTDLTTRQNYDTFT